MSYWISSSVLHEDDSIEVMICLLQAAFPRDSRALYDRSGNVKKFDRSHCAVACPCRSISCAIALARGAVDDGGAVGSRDRGRPRSSVALAFSAPPNVLDRAECCSGSRLEVLLVSLVVRFASRSAPGIASGTVANCNGSCEPSWVPSLAPEFAASGSR